jgi:two-component system OmpR family sensor kinase
MRRLFLHFYLFILLMLLAIGWSVDRLWQNSQTDAVPGWVQLLGQSLAYQLTYPDQDPRQVAAQLDMPLQQMSLNNIPWSDAELNALERGQLVPLFSEDSVYFYQLQQDQLLQFGPVAFDVEASHTYLFTFLFLVLLGVAVALWLWPLARDIERLQRQLDDFGNGMQLPDSRVPSGSMLAPIANAVKRMAEQIRRLLLLQREMTQAVSHELRTPLARLKFALELQQMPEVERQAMLEDVRELDQLIDEMLDYARMESNAIQLNFEDVVVTELLQNLVEKLQMLPGPAILLQQPARCTAAIDAHYLERAIQNLLVNAKRYGKTQVVISLQASSDELVIQVEDDGSGIPIHQREAILQPFVRLDESRSKGRGGFGLGLAIVSRIVSWHRGSIRIDDSVLGGACFVIRIPRQQPIS